MQKISQLTKQSLSTDNTKVYYLFSIFIVITNIPKTFLIPTTGVLAYDLPDYLRTIGAILCILLCFHEFWITKKEFRVGFWYFILFFCLVFTSSYTVFLTKQTFLIINFILSLILLLILTDFIIFILLLFIGILAGYLLKYCITNFTTVTSENLILPDYQMLAFYSCFVIMLIILVTIYIKAEEEKAKIKSLQIFGKAIAHDIMNPLLAIQTQVEFLKTSLKVKDENIQDIFKDLEHIIEFSIKDTKLILGNIKNANYSYDDKEYFIKDVFKEAFEEYYMEENQRSRVTFQIKENFKFIGSKFLIKHVIFNLFKNALTHAGNDAKIIIWTEKNRLHFKDTGYGIKQSVIGNVFEIFYTESGSGSGIGLSFCVAAIKKINGSIQCISEYGKYTEFILTFPVTAQKQDETI